MIRDPGNGGNLFVFLDLIHNLYEQRNPTAVDISLLVEF